MGKVDIDAIKIHHHTDGARQYGLHLDEHNSMSPPCSPQAWGAIILAAQCGSIPQFRAALVSAFGAPWVDGLPEWTQSGKLVLAQMMADVSTL